MTLSRLSFQILAVFATTACTGGLGADDGDGDGGAGSVASGGDTSGTGGKPELPPEVPPHTQPGDCGLDQPAFCERFETPMPGGKGGEIDERVLGFSRWGHSDGALFTRPTATLGSGYGTPPPTFCGAPVDVIDAPNDVRLCDGQLNEVLNDGGDFGINSFRIRQPFNFTDRTGTIVFDVDAKKNDNFAGHGWWTEIWITEDPSPIPYHGAPTVGAYPRNGIGFQIIPVGCGFTAGQNEVGRIFMSRDHTVLVDSNQGGDECFTTEDGVMNRFKVLINKDRAEFYATDAHDPENMRLVTTFENLDLSFTFGYVHFQHAQYNAIKDGEGASPTQTYRWDNIGFDGPTHPTPRAYEVLDQLQPLPGALGIGYDLDVPKQVQVLGVDTTGATRATFNFNVHAMAGGTLRYRLNGNAWHTFVVSPAFDSDTMKSLSEEVPLDEIVDGTNTIEVERVDALSWWPTIGNMDLTLEVNE